MTRLDPPLNLCPRGDDNPTGFTGKTGLAVGLVPLDARPVCVQLPLQVAAIGGWPVYAPPQSLLKTASLKKPVDFAALKAWMIQTAETHAPTAWVWSADMVAYGGLIPSRIGYEALDQLQERITEALGCFSGVESAAFASILRIPNYNNAEEEPDYWGSFGEALYSYSVRQAQGLRPMTKELPDMVVQDFLRRRQRNFDLNRWLISQVQPEAGLAWLAFCQDDTGPVGLNVNEAEQLRAWLPKGAGLVQTGADELATCLLVRHWLKTAELSPKVWVVYGEDRIQPVTLPFDGLPLTEVIRNKLRLCGASLADSQEHADLVWLIHGAADRTGDHMEGRTALGAETSLAGVQRYLDRHLTDGPTAPNETLRLPVVLCDVAYANGGDWALTDWLMQSGSWQSLYGYAAWNTPGNALGSSLAMGLARWLAEKTGCYHATAFRQALQTRLLDDGVYQGRIRQSGEREQTVEWLQAAMSAYLKSFQVQPDACRLSWPCDRWFEIDIQWQAPHESSDCTWPQLP